ncbi:MAG: pyridoxal-phosphate dependent enzyme, partial [Myxococcota bacterium]|nr:pyridoxal-phosphate dependent enzyme [Myxococcota bacterium]
MTVELPSAQQVREARERIAGHVHRTAVLGCRSLDAIAGATLRLKCENLQKTGSFKARGATHAVARISPAVRCVVTHSSGNHGAALAFAARAHGLEAYVVVPRGAPASKRAAIAAYGGRIVECDPTMAARERGAMEIVERTGGRLVHPYDDPDVVRGQGTVALEAWEQTGGFDAIVVPVGGGGLLAGCAGLVRALGGPRVRVVAAEPAGADDAFRSWQAGRRVSVESPRTVADGLRATIGEHGLLALRTAVDEVVRVDDAQILEAMTLLAERAKLVVEPSGAVALAAAL